MLEQHMLEQILADTLPRSARLGLAADYAEDQSNSALARTLREIDQRGRWPANTGDELWAWYWGDEPRYTYVIRREEHVLLPGRKYLFNSPWEAILALAQALIRKDSGT